MPLSDFIRRKLSVAQALANGMVGGSYADGCLIISASLSATASLLWPGQGKDKARFVEAWVRRAGPALAADRISLPLLVQKLDQRGRITESEQLRKCRVGLHSGEEDRIVTGDDVDASEAEILRECPKLSVKDLRPFSYGSIFYQAFRSALVHEYELSAPADVWPMTHQAAHVSYTNHIVDHNPFRSERRIHFHVPWLIDVVQSVAQDAELQLKRGPLVAPRLWWLDGAP